MGIVFFILSILLFFLTLFSRTVVNTIEKIRKPKKEKEVLSKTLKPNVSTSTSSINEPKDESYINEKEENDREKKDIPTVISSKGTVNSKVSNSFSFKLKRLNGFSQKVHKRTGVVYYKRSGVRANKNTTLKKLNRLKKKE